MVLVSENGKNMDPPDLPHRFLVAIGGNVIHPAEIKGTAEEQVAIAHATGRALLPLMELENKLVITHRNGPVGGEFLIKRQQVSGTVPCNVNSTYNFLNSHG
jgi:carbamate kinase